MQLFFLLFAGAVFALAQEAYPQPLPKEGEQAGASSPPPSGELEGANPSKGLEEAKQDTIQSPQKKNAIDSEINYNAKDSIVFLRDGRGFFFGESLVKYQEVELASDFIEINIDSSLVRATGLPDSTGIVPKNPVFKDKAESFESKEIRYNFDSKKGYVIHTVSQQGEAYVVSERGKKMADDMFYMVDGKYTTCDLHEHPHFYLNLTKAKVKPGSHIVTGPAYLVIADVPLPLVLPFGYFPFSDGYSSGILMPSFGDELTRGFYLTNGGYYFAFSDYFDAALTGSIYTKGSWGLNLASTYLKRYKFRGNISMDYMVNKFGEKELPDYTKSTDFRLMWTHTKDSKSNPDLSLSASVNYATSSFEHNNLNSVYNPNSLAQNTRSSSVALTKRFAGTPFTMSSSVRADQISRDSIVSFVLPDLTVSMSRIQPFRRKNRIGKERWYEKIAMSYTGKMSNSITTKENKLKDQAFPRDWRNGVMHTIPVQASFNVLRYIAVTPAVTYNERWYFKSINQTWNTTTNVLEKDTIRGFNRVYDYNFNISANTRFYGFFKPMIGDKIDMIRWVITPTVGYGVRPDFGDAKYGYWNTYTRVESNGREREVYFSPYESEQYGVPGRGKSQNINFSLGNNVEMKVKSTQGDSIDFKKISLIENFSASGSYNLAVDSFQLSNISTNLRLRFTRNFGLSLSAAFDPYEYDFDDYGGISRVDKYRWTNYNGRGVRMPQLVGTGTSFGYNFSNETFKRKKKEPEVSSDSDAEPLTETPEEKPKVDENGYAPFAMPWNLSVDYSMDYRRSMRREDFNERKMQYGYALSHNVSFSGNIALTQKWRINASAHYNITEKEITYTNCGIMRDLHCWSMSVNFVPIGLYRSYNFLISVNSSMLQDLKYEKRSNPRDNIIW